MLGDHCSLLLLLACGMLHESVRSSEDLGCGVISMPATLFCVTIGSLVAAETLNCCLEEIMRRMRANMLKLNPFNAEFLLVESHSILGNGITLIVEGVVFSLKAHVCSLGVLLDPVLLLVAQVMLVARSAYYQLRFVC